MNRILVVEAGGSKTTYMSSMENGDVVCQIKQAFHPGHGKMEGLDFLFSEVELDLSRVFFYGAGCTGAFGQQVKNRLEKLFPKASVEVQSDLLGAARACLGNQKGLIGILGTGSAFARFEKNQLESKVPSVGYLLGDPGSGYALGRILLYDWLTNRMPMHISGALAQFVSAGPVEFRNQIYSSDSPVKKLASLTHFAAEHRTDPYIRACILTNFRLFVHDYIVPYLGESINLIGFTGGMAAHFQAELRECIAEKCHAELRITSSAIEGLWSYHADNE